MIKLGVALSLLSPVLFLFRLERVRPCLLSRQVRIEPCLLLQKELHSTIELFVAHQLLLPKDSPGPRLAYTFEISLVERLGQQISDPILAHISGQIGENNHRLV